MTREEFKNLYKQSLFEACEKWPEDFLDDWRKAPEYKVNKWIERVMVAIPENGVLLTSKESSFTILCKKLGIKQTVKGIQTALASCTGDK